jgi:hypothetical protein
MIRLVAEVTIAFLLVASVAACGERVDRLQTGTQSSSQMSPDGLVRAFVWIPTTSSTLGALSSQPYQVWLERTADEKAPFLVLRAEATDGIALAWKGPKTLEVCFGPTHIYYFSNRFDSVDQLAHQLFRVEVTLRQVRDLAECK